MLRIRLFCIISIFLSALYSSRAQDLEGLAVEYERAVYSGASLEEANAALIGKARCYKALGRYAEASSSLARIRMFALTPEERQEVLFQQELCRFMGGEFEQAAAMVEEVEPVSQDVLLLHALALAYCGRYDESEIYAARCISFNGTNPRLGELLKFYEGHPRVKSEKTATVLSFVPPLAHFYNEAYGEGLLSAGLNAASVGIIVANLVGGYWISGILGGGIALDYTLMGNRERNAFLVHKNNTNGPIAFGERLRALLGDILNDYD